VGPAGGGVKALHTTKVATYFACSGAQRWCDQWDSGYWGGLVGD